MLKNPVSPSSSPILMQSCRITGQTDRSCGRVHNTLFHTFYLEEHIQDWKEGAERKHREGSERKETKEI